MTKKQEIIIKCIIGLVLLIQAVFIILKLTSVINWEWYWVISPIIGSSVIAGLILCTIF